MAGIEVEVIFPNKKRMTVSVLNVQTKREPTCKKCHKKIRFAQLSSGKQIPIMAKDDQWYAHFLDLCQPV